MDWLLLLLGAALEVVLVLSLRPTLHSTRLWPWLLCGALALAVPYLLAHAMATLPTGTVYVVFSGIGTAGAAGLGVVIHHDPLTAWRIAAVALIGAGIVLAYATSAG